MASQTVILGLVRIFALLFAHLPIVNAAPSVALPIYTSAESPPAPTEPGLWLYLSVAAALVLSGGAFAGLTIALMGQVCSLSQRTVARRSLTRNPPSRMRFICK
jgi:metal transporter CNNM